MGPMPTKVTQEGSKAIWMKNPRLTDPIIIEMSGGKKGSCQVGRNESNLLELEQLLGVLLEANVEGFYPCSVEIECAI